MYKYNSNRINKVNKYQAKYGVLARYLETNPDWAHLQYFGSSVVLYGSETGTSTKIKREQELWTLEIPSEDSIQWETNENKKDILRRTMSESESENEGILVKEVQKLKEAM